MSNSIEKEEFKFEVDMSEIMVKVRFFITIIKNFELTIFFNIFRKTLIKKTSLKILIMIVILITFRL